MIPAALLLCGCALRHRPAAPEPARGPARDSLFQVDQRRGDAVVARGVVDGMLSVLAPNVVFLRAGVPAVYGRDGVRELLSAGAPAEGTTVTWEPLGGGVSYDLMSAYTYGVASRERNSASVIRLERYIAVWQRAARRAVADRRLLGGGFSAANDVAFSTNVVTPPLVACAARASRSGRRRSRSGQPVRRSVRSHGTWLRVVQHDRAGRACCLDRRS